MSIAHVGNLDDELKSRLRIRAARHDHSMEEDVRLILRDPLTESEGAEEQTGIGSTDGKRRRQLLLTAEAVISQDFHNRVLVFDADAAVEYAVIVVKRERSGRPSCSVSGYKTGW